MTPRLAPLPFAEWDDEVRAAMGVLVQPERINPRDAGNVLATLAHNPSLMSAYLHFNRYVLLDSPLPERLRELAIMRVAVLRNCPYLWSHHVPLAERAGLSPGEIAAIELGEAVPEADRVILQAVSELESQARVTDSTWTALGEHIGENQRMDLVFAVGCYGLLATVMNTYGIEDEDQIDGG